MKTLKPAFKMFLIMTVLTGIIYPAVMTLASNILFYDKAQGSLIKKNNVLIGSDLIAQKFESTKYFWPRPSAVDYNPLPSGGSNLSQNSAALKISFDERTEKIKKSIPTEDTPPQDLVFASGSGLDPEISVEAAIYQVKRVASVRTLTENAVREIIDHMTQNRQFGILGEERINVLQLNLALDKLSLELYPDGQDGHKTIDGQDGHKTIDGTEKN